MYSVRVYAHPMTKSKLFVFNSKLNKVVEYFTLSDVLILSAWGLFSPFLSVFVTDKIQGGTLAAAGFAATLMLITRSVLLFPIAAYLDAKKGERDDYTFLIIGSLIVSAVSLGFIFSTQVWHVYTLQMIYGVGLAFTYPSWSSIFSRHLDKHKEAFEWSFYDALVGIGTAVAAGIGGLVIDRFGYDVLFIFVSVFSLIGTLFIVFARNELYKR